MKRTKLVDRKLPGFTGNEEIGNMITHIVGGAFGRKREFFHMIFHFFILA